MTVAARVIEKFGGINPMSRALGHKHASTVQGWSNSGRIPEWRWPEILQAARAHGVSVSEEYALALDKKAVGAA